MISALRGLLKLVLIFVSLALLFDHPANAKALTRKASQSHGSTKVSHSISNVHGFQMLTFSQWKALPHTDQQLYLVGLQLLAHDLDQIDQDNHVEYQNAEFHWFQSLIPEAIAKNSYSGQSCVYAGWVSKFDANGRFCLNPPSGTCKGNQVQCQPLLYGSGLCVAPGKKATQSCETRAKSVADIANELSHHEDEWNQFRQALTDACRDPKDVQVRVCSRLQSRLAEIQDVVHFTTPPSAEESQVPTTSIASPVDTHQADTTDVTPERAEPHVEIEATPSDDEIQDAVKVPVGTIDLAHAIAPKKGCTPLKLNQPLDGPDGFTRGLAPLTLQQAQTLMCTSEPIDTQLLKDARAFILKRLNDTARMSRKDRAYNSVAFKNVLDNFDACIAQIKSVKAHGAIILDPGKEAEIRFWDNGTTDIKTAAISQGSLSGSAGTDLRGVGASLCKTRIIDAEKQVTGRIRLQQKSPGVQ